MMQQLNEIPIFDFSKAEYIILGNLLVSRYITEKDEVMDD